MKGVIIKSKQRYEIQGYERKRKCKVYKKFSLLSSIPEEVKSGQGIPNTIQHSGNTRHNERLWRIIITGGVSGEFFALTIFAKKTPKDICKIYTTHSSSIKTSPLEGGYLRGNKLYHQQLQKHIFMQVPSTFQQLGMIIMPKKLSIFTKS